MPGIKREHKYQRPRQRQMRIKLQYEATEERMRACFETYPQASEMTFEEAVSDDLLRRCIELHARFGDVKPAQNKKKSEAREKDDDSDSTAA